MNRIAYCIAAAVIFAAASVDAALVDFIGLGKNDGVDIYHNGNSFGVTAGEIKITVDGNALTSYCVDLDHGIKDIWTADIVPVSPFLNGGKAVAFLYDTFKGSVTTNVQAAALQVAIWEVVDDFGGSLNLGAGNFRLLNNAAVGTQANIYLAAIPGDVSGYNTTSYVLKSGWDPRSQNLIAPEPGAIVLMLLSLPILALRRRAA